MENILKRRLIILGSGPAGYSAGVYAARAGLNPMIITGMEQGGQLTTTTDVENWPGDSDGLQGPELMDRMLKHVESLNVEVIFDHIEEVNVIDKPCLLVGNTNKYECEALIIATGASALYLGLESEQKYMGKGVSACATCDGFFYKDKDVAVIGGGNTAVEEALYLSNICSSVTLVHRRDELRAENILQERLFEKEKTENVKIIWNHQLNKIIGNELTVTGLELKEKDSSKVEILKIDGVFIAIGHKPNTDLFINQLDMKNGYIKIFSGLEGNATASAIPGIFAAGDVADHVYRQAITSAGAGCMAALDAEKYLATSNS
jgi:thioredoxin reductase (NADPH)